MKSKFVRIRYKIVLAYILSAILSGLCIIILSVICAVIVNNRVYGLLKWINSHIIAIPAILLMVMLLFFALMSAFFLRLTKRSTRYLEEITKALQVISSGDLDIAIPVRTSDELGELSQIINNMTIKLKSLLEEERSWERAKDELVANVSHDLRTPLTSIMGYVELISRADYSFDPKLQGYIKIIHDKCMHLKKLIDDLFEYSKLNSSGIAVNKTNVNLGELLEQVMLGFIPALEKAGMEYRTLSKVKSMVSADPSLLARLLENLIGNAINYGIGGKYIDVELQETSDEAVIRIGNYGEGIPAESLPHIFERLYRVEKSRTSHKEGTGLGLAIVKSIVELHNGKINVSSKCGKTVFEVRLNKISLVGKVSALLDIRYDVCDI